MAKSATKKSNVDTGKSPAAFNEKNSPTASQSTINPSRYAPGSVTDVNVQALDPENRLFKLFTDSVKDIYWPESQLTKALPKMANPAGNAALKKAISNHLDQTIIHVERLENIFGILGKKVQAKKCDAMEGLTKEGEAVIEDTDKDTPARDIGIINGFPES